MHQTENPLVSILIPVHNGEEFIGEAIRSVQNQSYASWDLTIVNNCSTDRTRSVAQRFADSDMRVRVHDNPRFLNVVENHNHAFMQTSPKAKYCKILGADDWLFPDCLRELVAKAEQYPNVGMVTAYALAGSRVKFDGLPVNTGYLTGRDVCRMRLLEGIKCFGGPSASLTRASIVRAAQAFYNPLNYHGDDEACLALLQCHDFAFVHQVLSFKRCGQDSRTTAYLDRVDSAPAADLHELLRFGPIYLTAAERADRIRIVSRQYYRSLARNLVGMPSREFLHYHFVWLRAMGLPLSKRRLALHIVERILDLILNPKCTMERIVSLLRRPSAAARGAQSSRVANNSEATSPAAGH